MSESITASMTPREPAIDAGGAAFPCEASRHPDIAFMHRGMTLRDWFAGQAIGAIISVTSAGQHRPGVIRSGATLEGGMATDAYMIADAMIAARKGGAA